MNIKVCLYIMIPTCKLHKMLSEYLSPDHTGIRVIPVWGKRGLESQATHKNQNWIQQYSFNLAYKLALEDRSPKISSFTGH